MLCAFLPVVSSGSSIQRSLDSAVCPQARQPLVRTAVEVTVLHLVVFRITCVFVAWVSPPQRGQVRVRSSWRSGSRPARVMRPLISVSERFRALPKVLSLSVVKKPPPDSHRETVAWLVMRLLCGSTSAILRSRSSWLIPRRPSSVRKDSRYAFMMKPTWAVRVLSSSMVEGEVIRRLLRHCVSSVFRWFVLCLLVDKSWWVVYIVEHHRMYIGRRES